MARSSTLAAVMLDIQSGEISRADAAARLGVSERTVNRLMAKAGVSRPPSPALAARAAAAERREKRRAAARAVRAGELTPEAAAKAAKVHVRTIYRHLERLDSAGKREESHKKRRKQP